MKQIENAKLGEYTKDLGQVFTPNHIIDLILDEVGYCGEKIIDKKIIEPSFGDGAFLLKIIQRLIDSCKANKKSEKEIIEILNNNIYGVEIDPKLYSKTINKLNVFLEINGLEHINWENLVNANTLRYENEYRFDYVVGNPPYVRIHNIEEEDRKLLTSFIFSEGTTDLYILFFEKAINMLNNNGKLGFITPNSYMINSSQKKFRKYLMNENLIKNIIDFKSELVFEGIGTYTAITILDKQKKDNIFSYKVHEKNKEKFVTNYSTLDFEALEMNISWNFDTEENTNLLNTIKNRSLILGKYATIQYGIATNKDSVYIGTIEDSTKQKKTVYFKNGLEKDKKFEIEKSLLKNVVKGSAYNGEINNNSMIIFPYLWNKNKKMYEVIQEDILKEKYPLTYKYFQQYKSELENRNLHANTLWYEFGRSQGLNNSIHKKLVIKNVFNENQEVLKVFELPKDTIVYSGIYITCQEESHLDKVKKILESVEFCKYAKIIGKNMAGGYKNISSNNIKSYGINEFIGKEYFELPEDFNRLNNEEKDNYWEKYINTVFLEKLKLSYKEYINSPRSTDRIKEIHSFIAEAIQFKLGNDFIIKANGFNLAKDDSGNEVNVEGKYYNKNVDIAVIKNGYVLGSVGVKLIGNNFNQNANNYFENMLGETANLRANNQSYSQLIVIPESMPYYNQNKVCKEMQHIKEHHISKYFKLSKEQKGVYHKPDLLSLVMIKSGDKDYYEYLEKSIQEKKPVENKYLLEKININYSDIDNLEHIKDIDTKSFLKKHMNLNNFLNAFAHLVLANSYAK